MKMRARHKGVVFEGLSDDDKRRLDGFLAALEPAPGLEGLVPTDPPAVADPMPEAKRKRGRRA